MSKRVCQWLLVCLAMATGAAWAASDPFVGTWKLNPAKSHTTDRMKVEAAGPNTYAFTFGIGAAETIVANGTDQPGKGGTLLSVAIDGPDAWTVVRKKDGHMMLRARWKLSADGQTLTDSFTAFRPDGSTSTTDYIYKRKTPGSGFLTTWESTPMPMPSAFELQIQPYQDGGLTFSFPAQQRTRQIKFDGKDYPETGPNATDHATSSGHRANEHSLTLTNKINGHATSTQDFALSSDLEMLTITARPAGGGTPDVLVFDRQ